MDYMKQIHAQMNNSKREIEELEEKEKPRKVPSRAAISPPNPTAVANWGVNYIVLTSLNRDDLVDGRSIQFGLSL